MKKFITCKSGCFGLIVAICMTVAADETGSTQFSDDFLSDPLVNSRYSTAVDPGLTLEYRKGKKSVRAIGSPKKGNFSVVTEVHGPGADKQAGFVVKTDSVSTDDDGSQMALYALVDGPNTKVNAPSGYTANFKPEVGLRIFSDGAEKATAEWKGAVKGQFNLSLEGKYNQFGELELTFTVSDGNASQSVSYIHSKPAKSTFFGFGGRVLSGSGGRKIEFSDFSVAQLP